MLELGLGGQVGGYTSGKEGAGGAGLGSLQEDRQQDGAGRHVACRGWASVCVGLQVWV